MEVSHTAIEEDDIKNTNVEDQNIDPIEDIIDYLVRCANISFKNAHVQEEELRTADKIKLACDLYKQSPTRFLLQFGKYLSPNHLDYFKNIQPNSDDYSNISLQECITQLERYHANRYKRVRNRRYKALQKLQQDSDYFTDKEMMSRNPLLYEQLVGQYMTDDEIRERDSVDSGNITLLNMILDTIDRSEMREMKNEQMLEENEIDEKCPKTNNCGNASNNKKSNEKQWGAFDVPDTEPSHMPEMRPQSMINANERNLLREEFLQEMYSSFMEGRDVDIDYNSIDNNEEYDDLEQISRDAEDKYFDSETNETETLEEHMDLVEMYKKTNLNESTVDPLDEFMEHISRKVTI